MDRIERGLHEHHASISAASGQAGRSTQHDDRVSTAAHTPSTPDVPEIPFAVVNSVVPNSPADTAGLQAGDRIRRFDDVNWLNHEKLSKVKQVVQRREGVSLYRVQGAVTDALG